MVTCRRRWTVLPAAAAMAGLLGPLAAGPDQDRAAAAVLTAPSAAPAGVAVPTGPGAGATASAAAWRRSTPVRMPTPEGRLSSYVVNADRAGAGRTGLAERAVRSAGGTVVASWPQIGVVVAHSRRQDFRDAVVARAQDRAVLSAAPTRTVAVSGDRSGRATLRGLTAATEPRRVAADPLEHRQWDMTQIKAQRAHAVTGGSRDVVVAVLDTGIDGSHPDLAANIDRAGSVDCSNAGRPDRSPGAWQPTVFTHGTHVAGTIAAARNGRGIVGVAPNVRVASVKVVDDAGLIYPEYAICGFMWSALRGMDVANNSYFVDPFYFWCADRADQAASLLAVQRAIGFAQRRGVVVVASTGNEAADLADKRVDAGSPDDRVPVARTVNNGCKELPAEAPGVVAVSSTDRDGSLSAFANYGLGVVDVAAPGADILSTLWGGGYGRLSGTSMAAPHVAGVLALMRSQHPAWTPLQLRAALAVQADDRRCPAADRRCRGTSQRNGYFGEGLVDALAAVR